MTLHRKILGFFFIMPLLNLFLIFPVLILINLYGWAMTWGNLLKGYIGVYCALFTMALFIKWFFHGLDLMVSK